MNIDLGWLGKVLLEDIEPITPHRCSFKVVKDGYTESGIRVQGVLDSSSDVFYPKVWQNAILIKVGDL